MVNGWEEVRRVVANEAAIPALRVCLFLFALLTAYAWQKRRPNLAVVVLACGGLLGLSFWLIQMVAPLGLGTNASLSSEWAQAGVNTSAEPKGDGFVQGTAAASSLISILASLGLPLGVVFASPQMVAVACFFLLILLPWSLIRNRTTAAFAACLAAGSGLWPGASPWGSLLLRPSFAGMVLIAGGVLLVVVMARGHVVRKVFHRHRMAISVILIVGATLDLAFEGGAQRPAVAALLLTAASILLASPLRAILRQTLRSSGTTRRAEALCLLAAFSGSGLFWWNPPKTLAGFKESRDRGTSLRRPLDWIAVNVPPNDVILASTAYSAPIAALAGRRVLFAPLVESGPALSVPGSARRTRLFESTLRGRPIARLAEAFSVTHLFLGPGEATPVASAEPDPPGDPRLRLVLVYQDMEDFRVFRLAKK
jgi:hypothetical protein